MKVWDATSDQRLTNYAGHARQVMTIAWAPDSRRLASGDIGGTVQVWVVTTKRCLITYTGYKDGGTVYALAWSPDGKYIASASEDWTVQVWSASEQMSNAG